MIHYVDAKVVELPGKPCRISIDDLSEKDFSSYGDYARAHFAPPHKKPAVKAGQQMLAKLKIYFCS